MRSLIIHAGFHKTGTTSLQKTLRANRHALRPGVRLVLRAGMQSLCEAARGYSLNRSDLDLGLVKYEAAQLAERLESEIADTIFITSEDLAGHMPGRHGLRGYDAAPDLMRGIAVAFGAVAPDDRITFLFTTRAAKPWLRSCYAQHLRASRMAWDERDYERRLNRSAELDAVIAKVAREVPDHRIETAALEHHIHRPLGIAEAAIDLMDLPGRVRSRLRPVEDANRPAPDPAILAELLAINRSDRSDAEAKSARRVLLRGGN